MLKIYRGAVHLTLLFVAFGGAAVFAQSDAKKADAAKSANKNAKAGEKSDGPPPVAPKDEPQEAQRKPYTEATFPDALSDFESKRYRSAAAGFFIVLDQAEATDADYEWARYFLAESLASLDFWHAATRNYHAVAKVRAHPELVPDALAKLENISQTRPFDEELVYHDLLYGTEFGSLPKDIDAWIRYAQGLYDYRNGFKDWGERHFSGIVPSSPYAAKANYVRAVHALKAGKDALALQHFEDISKADVLHDETKNLALTARARLHYDLGQYEQAWSNYESTTQNNLSFQQAEILVEKAWTAYALGRFETAMGLSHALFAPSYEDFFLPDAYLLQGMILKERCHYLGAKKSIRAFQRHYKKTLESVKRRIPLSQVPMIRHAATQLGRVADRTRFIGSLRHELRLLEKVDGVWGKSGLYEDLKKMYTLELEEQLRHWKKEFSNEADEAALQLLEMDQQMNLLDYEVGLDIFKRYTGTGSERVILQKEAPKYDDSTIAYDFDVEYWSDELNSFLVQIENRCIDGDNATIGSTP